MLQSAVKYSPFSEYICLDFLRGTFKHPRFHTLTHALYLLQRVMCTKVHTTSITNSRAL